MPGYLGSLVLETDINIDYGKDGHIDISLFHVGRYAILGCTCRCRCSVYSSSIIVIEEDIINDIK